MITNTKVRLKSKQSSRQTLINQPYTMTTPGQRKYKKLRPGSKLFLAYKNLNISNSYKLKKHTEKFKLFKRIYHLPN